MDDLIKRSDAIKALRLEYPMMPMFKSLREEWAIKTEGFRKAEEVIMGLPSADIPSVDTDGDRPQGEWIVNIPNSTSVCSVCGASEADFIYGTEMWYGLGESKFCPSCGARMLKGADDD